MRIKIKNDLFDISDRVKEINPNYEIFYDTEKKKFVLMKGKLVSSILPYETLDVRTLDYVYKTRAENGENLLKEIDSYNEKKTRDSVSKSQDEIENEFSRQLRLLKI